MVFFNYSTMQMAAKIVYYGPGLCGKTTNLHWIYSKTADQSRGEMVSLETETDRTLFFDLLPIDVGQVAGFNTRIQLYTVPGQVFYNTTRKLVLKGVDGVVFVADSQRAMLDANVQSFKNLEENLAEMDLTVDELPIVLQYNKRDLSDICSKEELDEALNRNDWPSFEAIAIEGTGVFETLKGVSRETLMSLRKRLTSGGEKEQPSVAKPTAPQSAAQNTQAPAAPSQAAATPSPPATAPKAATPASPAQPAPPAAQQGAQQGEQQAEAAPAAKPGRKPGASRPVRKKVDVDGELARLRKEALQRHSATRRATRRRTSDRRSAAEGSNGKRELSRDIKMTLKRPDFDRARRFTLSFQVKDDDDQVVDSVQGLQVDLGDLASGTDLSKVLLRLNIALQPKE